MAQILKTLQCGFGESSNLSVKSRLIQYKEDNLLEAVTDLLVHAGILADDHYGIVVPHDGSRCYVDRDNPRTEITITRVVASVPKAQK